MQNIDYNPILIIGGGLFGLTAAIIFAENGHEVLVVEKEKDILRGATQINQNRIHYGYHYPRSLQTGKEALEGLDAFTRYYGDAIYEEFTKYYAIAKDGSYLTASEFVDFCKVLNIPLEERWPSKEYLNHDLIEACWKVYEPVFDYNILRRNILKRIQNLRNIKIVRNAELSMVEQLDDIRYRIELNNGYTFITQFIINATYSGLNSVLHLFGLERVKANYELLILPILETQSALSPIGVTIMDGPFCSIMPKGKNSNQFILSHVRNSVVQSHIGTKTPLWNPVDGWVERDIINASALYYPFIKQMDLVDSWITTKMVLPNQEIDDARPTMVINHRKNLISVFSGKITTCVSAANELYHTYCSTK